MPSPTTAATTAHAQLLSIMEADRCLAIVRAETVPDVRTLAKTLAGAGIHALELTFTTPNVVELLREATSRSLTTQAPPPGGAASDVKDIPLIGVGTVMSAEQANAAIVAGAQFLVTPGIRKAVAEAGAEAGIPVVMGAMTPSEVAEAVDLGAAVVKLFPARHVGATYLRDLRGPYPHVPLLASGGIDAGNARAFLEAGAQAVCCGSSVLSAQDVAGSNWAAIARKAHEFVSALGPQQS